MRFREYRHRRLDMTGGTGKFCGQSREITCSPCVPRAFLLEETESLVEPGRGSRIRHGDRPGAPIPATHSRPVDDRS